MWIIFHSLARHWHVFNFPFQIWWQEPGDQRILRHVSRETHLSVSIFFWWEKMGNSSMKEVRISMDTYQFSAKIHALFGCSDKCSMLSANPSNEGSQEGNPNGFLDLALGIFWVPTISMMQTQCHTPSSKNVVCVFLIGHSPTTGFGHCNI